MVRRSFRLGLRLGLLAGILFALVKVVQARRSSREDAWAPAGGDGVSAGGSDTAWPPLTAQPEPITVEPPTPTVPVPEAPVKLAVDPTSAVAGPTTAGPKEPAAKQPVAPEAPAAPKQPVAPAPPEPEAQAAPPPPAPARKAAKRTAKRAGTRRRRRPWVEAMGNECPTSHPVKAKLKSMLYHLPGMAAYNRTRPDRCYVDGEAAEADGFRRAKR